ncbi:MAG: sigma-E processing peptidase SpoIIGA [Oscillospiraceae bacterium]|nr:sigma-E processing peptidase SpoIIGA [Oscillospiraceae bacterium]
MGTGTRILRFAQNDGDGTGDTDCHDQCALWSRNDRIGAERKGVGMAVVYIDEVFLVNAAVDWLLLKTALSLTGGGTRPRRLWAGAGFGGLAACAACLPGLGWLGSLPGAALAYSGLCLICFGWRGRAWKSWLWFFCVCCGFAGLALTVCSLLRIPAFTRGGRIYYRLSGRLLVLLAAAVYGLCRLLLDRFARHRGRELLRLELTLGERTACCSALRDTGNTLSDPVTGEPALVASWRAAARLLPELGLTKAQFEDPAGLLLRLAEARPELRTRLLPFRAVGVDRGLLAALVLDRVAEDGKPVPTRLAAFSPTELSDGGGYEAIVQG